MNHHSDMRTPEPLGSCGNAIIELALVMPVLILIGLCAIEISHSLSQFQAGTTLSKELARLAFQLCAVDRVGAQADATNRGEGDNIAQQCLTDTLSRFQSEFVDVVPTNTKFVLSMYTIESGSAHLEGKTGADADAPGKFDTNALDETTAPGSALAKSLARYETVVIAEAYVARSLPKLFPFSIERIYTNTIL